MPKIMLYTDTPFTASGVGNQARHIAFELLKNGYEVCVTAIVNFSVKDTPGPVNYQTQHGVIKVTHAGKQSNDMPDLSVFYKNYQAEHPDLVILFTDPKFYLNLCLDLSKLIRSQVPILYVHVWDTHLLGQTKHYNQWVYQSVDHLSCISRQTEWFVNQVLKNTDYPEHNPTVSYVGHGSDPSVYKPLPIAEYQDIKTQLLSGKNIEFVAFMNGNNQHRKKMSDVIEAFRLFNEQLTPEQAAKTALVLHTSLATAWGTDLNEVAKALGGNCNIVFSTQKLNEATLNKLYNIADVVINNSNAAGFELSANEAALSGKCTIINITGGLTDQAGYDNFVWTPDNYKQLKNQSSGPWCYAIHGQRTIIGSPATPYLYDYNASIDDIAAGLMHWYGINKDERNRLGQLNRQFAIDNQLTSDSFAKSVLRDVKSVLANFKAKPTFSLFKV